MSKKLPTLTMSDWMEAMNVVDKIPDGWKSRVQIQNETGLKKDAISMWIRENPDRVQTQSFLININGINRRIPHYKLKPNHENNTHNKRSPARHRKDD